MALSPAAVAAERAAARAQQIAQIETALDGFIEQNFESNQLVYDVAASVKTSVFDEIVNRYRNAGWLVEVRTDFHNNRQLVLSSPS